MKDDPIKRELQKQKERIKYENKKRRKQVKSVKEMTPREVRCKRNKWRKYSNDYYKRKQNTDVLPDSPPCSTSSSPTQLGVLPVQKNSGRKRIHMDRNKIIQRNRRLILENERLKKSKEKYRRRYYRIISQCKQTTSNDLTPKTKVKKSCKIKTETH